jgi:hypothetical protein
MWTLFYAPAASAGIRRVPRGPAADVTAAIGRLASTPLPFNAIPAPSRPDAYIIEVQGHLITYQMDAVQRSITILTVE